MKTTKLFKTLSLAALLFAGAAACGVDNQASSSAQSLHGDHEMARRLVVKCSGKISPEAQLALELSKTCREQNAELKAKGYAACQEDFCSEALKVSTEKKGILEVQYDGKGVGLAVTISSDFSFAATEKSALICYAPVLKARELLSSSNSRCD
ncbi:MAG: hypothetical protein FJY29_05950 [Betaproteobacteria bacterium]|nr:hypothetical protein [Betaproteobacteria bacterium]